MIQNANVVVAWMGFACLAALTATGCNQQAAEGKTAPPPKIDVSRYVLANEPEGAIGVITAREEAQDGDEVVVVARIGGRKNPWIENRAAFMVIDASMMLVADSQECKEGQICMDDCCAALRAECTTLVKIVDDQGKTLAVDARKIVDAKQNDMIVVSGRVERDKKEGTFVVVADGVYLRR